MTPRAASLAPRFLHAGAIMPDPAWRMDSHLHPFHELIVVVRGRLHVVLGGEGIEAREGDVLLYRAGVAHEEQSDAQHPVETRYIGFEWDALPASLPAWSRDARGRVTALVQWLREDRDGPAPGEPDPRGTILGLVLHELARAAPPEDSDLVQATRAHLRERLAEPLTLDDVARHAGLSKFHFLRRYRELSGRTPMEDLRRLRLEHARELILTTRLPLKAIAPMAGLGDQHHMTRLFRAHFGMTPGELRGRAGR